eukprot:TRINITY_DN5345_c0_g1_i2.p1 TRINITY_DN5345_c0_g1~~TRINITY_DN5345_c0_g1_i2.p1  ORF type:complete len:438 (+),score=70.91 TRINITY_DN5345_c0_g1_i2:144-1316(+)
MTESNIRMMEHAAATDKWDDLIARSGLMTKLDNVSGLLTTFAKATETGYGDGGALFSQYFGHKDFDDLKYLYMDKVREVYEAYSGKEEKVRSGPPLGRLVHDPEGDVFGTGVPDPDPLITGSTEESRVEEVLKLQRKKKDLELGVLPKAEDIEALEHEMGETYDRLEYATRKYWKILLHQTSEEISSGRFWILVSSCFEFLVAIVLFALGAQQLEGGRTMVVIATFASSIVAVTTCCFGFFGALPDSPNEYALYLYYASQIWLLALLTTFVFVELNFINDNDSRCSPSLASYATTDKCANRAELIATLVVGFIKLLNVLFSSYTTTALLDDTNYQSSLNDKFLLFKYKSNIVKELQMPIISNNDWNYSRQLQCVDPSFVPEDTAPDDGDE